MQRSQSVRLGHQKFLLKLLPFDPSLVGSPLSSKVVERATLSGCRVRRSPMASFQCGDCAVAAMSQKLNRCITDPAGRLPGHPARAPDLHATDVLSPRSHLPDRRAQLPSRHALCKRRALLDEALSFRVDGLDGTDTEHGSSAQSGKTLLRLWLSQLPRTLIPFARLISIGNHALQLEAAEFRGIVSRCEPECRRRKTPVCRAAKEQPLAHHVTHREETFSLRDEPLGQSAFLRRRPTRPCPLRPACGLGRH